MSKTEGSMINNLTEGNVAKQLLVFAAPLFLSNALQAVTNSSNVAGFAAIAVAAASHPEK